MKLTDYFDAGVTSTENRGYSIQGIQQRVLRRLLDHTPLLEIRKLENLKKQALNKSLRRLILKRWVEKLGHGVYEVTKEGKNALNESIPQPIVGSVLKSVHHFKVRFNLKGWRFDKAGLRKSRKGHWVDYLDSEGVTIEATKRGLFVQVHGLRGSDALALARSGAERARSAALAFCARRGARVYAVGELVQVPHWVLEDKAVSRALIGWLDLRKGKLVQAGGLTWFTDASHAGLVEARGGVPVAVAAFKEFDYLVSGALRRDLVFVVREIGGVKEVAREVAALREDLRFVPRGGARREVA